MYCKDKHTFEVGDYIGDENDATWIVDSVSEEEYIISSAFYTEEFPKRTKTLNRVKLTELTEWNRKRYDNDVEGRYHLLRPKDHEDIINFPIRSRWRCTKDCGLHDKNKDIVTIYSYAYSEGMFWVESTGCRGAGFLVDRCELKPLPKGKE